MTQENVIIQVNDVVKSFRKSETQDLLVLDKINFTMRKGEIVALLGRSGSGKSTLLRIIAGLIPPTSGEVIYRQEKVMGPVQGVAMVFQNFALMPWLTVLQNVELGLEALGVPKAERRVRALKAIDIIGLDGFESAFPKEISGGMKQRVGFARALVVNPDILLMDEPFSALDVLTADNLKSDLLDLWQEKKTNTNGILFVTHNIEEAAYLADRIIVFGSEPGFIRAELNVNLPHPRNEQTDAFRKLVDQIYTLMTTRPQDEKSLIKRTVQYKKIGLGYRLPDVDVAELSGLLETLDADEHKGRMDLPEMADYLHLNIDDLFPITEVLEILGFATVSAGDIELTKAGIDFANADILERKKIFANHLLKSVPLVERIKQVLDERPNHRANKERFVNELEDHLSESEADRTFLVAVDWGRYAEIFAYDSNTGVLSLENPH
ncbi:MAG TPA: nitrate/sulfonate/bicarbonate ABC transporter ATP-binding protein [Gammaproteobacteria bacterium]|nr:nitrate/sulfonate/bicarbonate ABC transporter ATP-binding protein [Gammaproteobacteria bacterium]